MAEPGVSGAAAALASGVREETNARPVVLLTVCGSLQARSANRAALDVATDAASVAGAEVVAFDRLADLPAFDAGRSDEPPAAVAEWRDQMDGADAVLVAVPEYAGGMAGAMKNALDWLVTSASLYRRPVAVMSAGTSGGHHALAQAAQTVTWQGGYVLGVLGIAAPITRSDDQGRFTDGPTLEAIRALVRDLLAAASGPGSARAAAARSVAAGLGIEAGHVVPPA